MRIFLKKSLVAVAACVQVAAAADSNIRFNTLGFLPDKNKRASINAACSKFDVIRVPAGTTAFSGSVTGPVKNPDTGEDLYTADFSALTEEGTYYLSVKGVGRSPDFPVKKGVYNFAYHTVMRGMYLWRCGCEVSGTYNGNRFSHGPCHIHDAYLDFVGGGNAIKPSLKGWHDAGDYNKYTVNAGITVGMMLDSWLLFKPLIGSFRLDIPESGGALPDFLAEVKWELDWLLTMQFDNGSVSHKVSTRDFGGFIMPEAETAQRYFVQWGSAATADFTAMLAMAARIYKQYDQAYAGTCLAAAVKSYGYLSANPNDHQADQAGFTTGAYGTSDPDDRLWAAAELWETTGEQKYLSDFETRANKQSAKIDEDWDWGNVKNLGMFTYLLSDRPGKNAALNAAVKGALLKTADTIVAKAKKHGYGRPLGPYYWGCNGTVARQAMALLIANTFLPDTKYLNATLDAIGFLFGRNSYCRSFVTGLGHNPPVNPHDRRSGADGIKDPWPGYIVGGPWPDAASWVDIDTNYQTNEIAINWQGALVFALAGFVDPQSNGAAIPKSQKHAISPARRAINRALEGGMKIRLPAGRSDIYDCKGTLLKRVEADRPRFAGAGELGLGSGVVIVKSGLPERP